MADSPRLPPCVVDTSVLIDLHVGGHTSRSLRGFYR
jgi:hypothetical protein